MTKIRCTSEYKIGTPPEEVDPQALAEWLVTLPPGVKLTALTHQVGSQRDPVERFVGIHASWEEER